MWKPRGNNQKRICLQYQPSPQPPRLKGSCFPSRHPPVSSGKGSLTAPFCHCWKLTKWDQQCWEVAALKDSGRSCVLCWKSDSPTLEVGNAQVSPMSQPCLFHPKHGDCSGNYKFSWGGFLPWLSCLACQPRFSNASFLAVAVRGGFTLWFWSQGTETVRGSLPRCSSKQTAWKTCQQKGKFLENSVSYLSKDLSSLPDLKTLPKSAISQTFWGSEFNSVWEWT